MSYNYTQLHEIIEMQYKNNGKIEDKNKKFLNESAKLLKGYINPSTYLNNIMSSTEISIVEDPPIYIDK